MGWPCYGKTWLNFCQPSTSLTFLVLSLHSQTGTKPSTFLGLQLTKWRFWDLSASIISCCYSVSKSCLTLCNPMDCSTSGLPVFHYLTEFAETHVHWDKDAIQPYHPLLLPSPRSLSIFLSIRVFQWISFQWIIPMNLLFASGGQSIRSSASASVLLVYIQGWFPLVLIGLNSLLSKGLSRVFSSTTIWKLQFFSIQSFSWSNSHIHTGQLGKP